LRQITSLQLEAGAEPVPGYCLVQFLGRGGFGEVWEAESPQGTRVAMKFLPCGSSDKAAQENRSIQMVRQLGHANLIRIDDTWCLPGYLVVAMELAEGTLQDLYEAFEAEFGTPISTEQLWPLLSQAAEALDFLNRRQHRLNGQCVGIQHCDIKPSNLLLFGDMVKLSDYSLASTTTSGMKMHQRSGTTAYCAPEVFQGRLSDRTDQYALAVTYCQLRTGRLPFHDSPKHFTRSYVRPAPDLAMLSDVERPLIARALAPVPMDRWRSCGELVAQLRERVAAYSGIPSPRPLRVQADPPPPEGDRRAATRCSCTIPTSWRFLGEDSQAYQSNILDISTHGIGLVNDRCLKLGTILVVIPQDRPEKVSRPYVVRVIHVEAHTAGRWLHGCRFMRALEADELEALLEPELTRGRRGQEPGVRDQLPALP
jgi:serine/threonine protein kinase